MHLSTNACQKKAFKYSNGSSFVKKRNFFIEFRLNCIANLSENGVWRKCIFHRSVLIERAHYYTILREEARTIREGVLIEESALTKVVRYFVTIALGICWITWMLFIAYWKKIAQSTTEIDDNLPYKICFNFKFPSLCFSPLFKIRVFPK